MVYPLRHDSKAVSGTKRRAAALMNNDIHLTRERTRKISRVLFTVRNPQIWEFWDKG